MPLWGGVDHGCAHGSWPATHIIWMQTSGSIKPVRQARCGGTRRQAPDAAGLCSACGRPRPPRLDVLPTHVVNASAGASGSPPSRCESSNTTATKENRMRTHAHAPLSLEGRRRLVELILKWRLDPPGSGRSGASRQRPPIAGSPVGMRLATINGVFFQCFKDRSRRPYRQPQANRCRPRATHPRFKRQNQPWPSAPFAHRACRTLDDLKGAQAPRQITWGLHPTAHHPALRVGRARCPDPPRHRKARPIPTPGAPHARAKYRDPPAQGPRHGARGWYMWHSTITPDTPTSSNTPMSVARPARGSSSERLRTFRVSGSLRLRR